jgi:putative flippase GtrA
MKDYFRSFLNRESATQITKVAIIGVVNTIVDFSVFNVLRELSVGLYPAVIAALVVATFVSYLLNRHYTFKLRDGKVSWREAAQFYVVNLVALGVTLGVVALAQVFFDPLSRLGENVAKAAAIVIILLPKFAAYRDVVFGEALAHRAASEASPESGSAPTVETPPGQ